MSEGVSDMSGVMFYQPATSRRAPGGLPGAAVRLGRLLELWGYRAARPRTPQASIEGSFRMLHAHREGGVSSLMVSRPRIY